MAKPGAFWSVTWPTLLLSLLFCSPAFGNAYTTPKDQLCDKECKLLSGDATFHDGSCYCILKHEPLDAEKPGVERARAVCEAAGVPFYTSVVGPGVGNRQERCLIGLATALRARARAAKDVLGAVAQTISQSEPNRTEPPPGPGPGVVESWANAVATVARAVSRSRAAVSEQSNPVVEPVAYAPRAASPLATPVPLLGVPPMPAMQSGPPPTTAPRLSRKDRARANQPMESPAGATGLRRDPFAKEVSDCVRSKLRQRNEQRARAKGDTGADEPRAPNSVKMSVQQSDPYGGSQARYPFTGREVLVAPVVTGANLYSSGDAASSPVMFSAAPALTPGPPSTNTFIPHSVVVNAVNLNNGPSSQRSADGPTARAPISLNIGENFIDSVLSDAGGRIVGAPYMRTLDSAPSGQRTYYPGGYPEGSAHLPRAQLPRDAIEFLLPPMHALNPPSIRPARDSPASEYHAPSSSGEQVPLARSSLSDAAKSALQMTQNAAKTALDSTRGIASGASSFAHGASDLVKGGWHKAEDLVTAGADLIRNGEVTDGVLKKAEQNLKSGVNAFDKAATTVAETVHGAAGAAWDGVKHGSEIIQEDTSKAVNKVKDIVEDAMKKGSNVAGASIDTIRDGASTVKNTGLEAVKRMGNLSTPAISSAQSIPSAINTAAQSRRSAVEELNGVPEGIYLIDTKSGHLIPYSGINMSEQAARSALDQLSAGMLYGMDHARSAANSGLQFPYRELSPQLIAGNFAKPYAAFPVQEPSSSGLQFPYRGRSASEMSPVGLPRTENFSNLDTSLTGQAFNLTQNTADSAQSLARKGMQTITTGASDIGAIASNSAERLIKGTAATIQNAQNAAASRAETLRPELQSVGFNTGPLGDGRDAATSFRRPATNIGSLYPPPVLRAANLAAESMRSGIASFDQTADSFTKRMDHLSKLGSSVASKTAQSTQSARETVDSLARSAVDALNAGASNIANIGTAATSSGIKLIDGTVHSLQNGQNAVAARVDKVRSGLADTVKSSMPSSVKSGLAAVRAAASQPRDIISDMQSSALRYVLEKSLADRHQDGVASPYESAGGSSGIAAPPHDEGRFFPSGDFTYGNRGSPLGFMSGLFGNAAMGRLIGRPYYRWTRQDSGVAPEPNMNANPETHQIEFQANSESRSPEKSQIVFQVHYHDPTHIPVVL